MVSLAQKKVMNLHLYYYPRIPCLQKKVMNLHLYYYPGGGASARGGEGSTDILDCRDSSVTLGDIVSMCAGGGGNVSICTRY